MDYYTEYLNSNIVGNMDLLNADRKKQLMRIQCIRGMDRDIMVYASDLSKDAPITINYDGKYDDTERQRLLELQAGCVKEYLGNTNVLLTKTERKKTFDALRKLQEVYEKFGMKWIPPYSADVFSDSNTDQTLLEAVIAEKENNVDFSSLEERIKELEEENERLSKENEELKEIMNTPLDAIEADSKVGLTEILKLMAQDGANFDKHNNKTIAVKALKMMIRPAEDMTVTAVIYLRRKSTGFLPRAYHM